MKQHAFMRTICFNFSCFCPEVHTVKAMKIFFLTDCGQLEHENSVEKFSFF